LPDAYASLEFDRDNSNPSKPKHHVRAHPLGITSLSIDERGSKALTVSVDGTIVLTDLETTKRLGKKQTFTEEIGEEGIGESVVCKGAWGAAF
jgi:hypothetical protein